MKHDDYNQPLFDMLSEGKKPGAPEGIPVVSILNKLNGLYDAGEYEKAKAVIDYWINDSEVIGDDRGQYTVLAEGLWLCYQTNDCDSALKYADIAINLTQSTSAIGEVDLALLIVAAANAICVFGEAGKALELYDRALLFLEGNLKNGDSRLIACYNNRAMAHAKNGSLAKATNDFYKALELSKKAGCYDLALTYLNMSTVYFNRNDLQVAREYAKNCFDVLMLNADPSDEYYSYICKRFYSLLFELGELFLL